MTAQTLHSRFTEARAKTDQLFRMVKQDAMYDRPIPERHRIVFYVGHLEAFDRNLLAVDTGAQAELDRLFAFGIDPVDGNLPSDIPSDWPKLETVYGYRDETRRELDRLIGSASEEKINVAIEHRLMHAETLAYIFHQMPFDRKHGVSSQTISADLPPAQWIRIPAGETTLGLNRDSGVFGWDNEFDELRVSVPEFAIEKRKVSNSGFLQFLNEGGYTDPGLWSPSDWEWKTAQGISHPVFWVKRGDRWNYRSMFEEIPLPPAEPVFVSHAEASAYVRWAGKALPSESQWQRAAYGAFGLEGAIGTGWEWTSTEFAPFPGFRPMPFYPGYSEPFFDGKHYVLKGGSAETAPVMRRPSFRNWFQPHYQYVYAGFRCIEKESR